MVSKTRAAALAGFLALALLPVSGLSVSADANPSNHGHHYGQLKHRAGPPPPPTVTPPTTNAPPPPAGGPGGAQNPTGADTSMPLPRLEVKLILPRVPMGEVNIVRAVPERDSNLWWLLVVLVIALAALWIFAALQLGRASLKSRRGQTAT